MTAVETQPNPAPAIPGVPASVRTDVGSASENPVPRYWAYDELLDTFPETNQPHELWDGELLWMPAPSFKHQKIVARLHRALEDWVNAHKLWRDGDGFKDMILHPRTEHSSRM
ncbi:MAG: Uma2 family endonuclease [Verrucomicrobiae bacterium]|nr:Uma2 family endonuclease [Verrucomicrobiae bacterium]